MRKKVKQCQERDVSDFRTDHPLPRQRHNDAEPHQHNSESGSHYQYSQ
jgi:hypothetical protein